MASRSMAQGIESAGVEFHRHRMLFTPCIERSWPDWLPTDGFDIPDLVGLPLVGCVIPAHLQIDWLPLLHICSLVCFDTAMS